MSKHLIRKVSLFLTLALACTSLNFVPETIVLSANENSKTVIHKNNLTGYATYLEKYSSKSSPDTEIKINILDFTASEGHAQVLENIGGRLGKCIKLTDSGYIEWRFSVEREGLYNIVVEYYNIKGKGSSILKTLKINGTSPFDEAVGISFSRVFTNNFPVEVGSDGNVLRSFSTDTRGNEVRPMQVETPLWQSKDITDNTGIYGEPLKFYFDAGEHTLTFDSIREPLVIGGVKLYQSPKVISDEAAAREAERLPETSGVELRIQGETAVRKSDSMLSPASDYSTPSTDPSSPMKNLLNIIGGANWQNPGQWIEYDFRVPQTGLYKIMIKARQNIASGQPSCRKLYIDGKVPFQSATAVKCDYLTNWQIVEPGGDNHKGLIYLEKGRAHTLRLEVSYGELADIIQRVNVLVERYLTVYRNMLMFIGPNPDLNRDYEFDVIIPDEIEELARLSSETEKIYEDFIAYTGTGGQQAQILRSITSIASKMSRNHRDIAKYFNDFSMDIAALGTFLASVKLQPLEIDYISIASPDVEFEKAEKSLWSRIVFSFKQFFYSFIVDYSVVSNEKENAVTVWLGSGLGGRDQAEVLSNMVQDSFIGEDNIYVNVKLVPPGALLTATLAGLGPDVALSLGQSDPVNYAIRGAVSDISQFESFSDVEKRFMPSAMEPMRFDGKVYGLPETQSFYMMFYREDILNQLDIKVPQTWDDVIEIIPTLQKQHLQFGLPLPYVQATIGAGFPAYAMFLFQQDGELYTEGGRFSALNTDAAIDAFNMWTRFYTDYGLLISYDALTRFRTGETPILIENYGFYNQLSVAAPELEGRWKFGLVPGIKQSDGRINRTVSSNVTSCVIMSAAKNKEHAWKFLDWWTSTDTQQKYAREIESILGTVGRYQPANTEAIYSIPWKTADLALLTEQLKHTKGIQEVPGSYMTPRYVDFAFKQIVVDRKYGADSAQIIIDASKLITGELKVKHAEFGLHDR